MVTPIAFLHHTPALGTSLPLRGANQLEECSVFAVCARSKVERRSAFVTSHSVTPLADGLSVVDAMRCNESRTSRSVAVCSIPSLQLRLLCLESFDRSRGKVLLCKRQGYAHSAAARRKHRLVFHSCIEQLVKAASTVSILASEGHELTERIAG